MKGKVDKSPIHIQNCHSLHNFPQKHIHIHGSKHQSMRSQEVSSALLKV